MDSGKNRLRRGATKKSNGTSSMLPAKRDSEGMDLCNNANPNPEKIVRIITSMIFSNIVAPADKAGEISCLKG